MFLHRLEIQGFKSFVDRTDLSFGDGLTGVIGFLLRLRYGGPRLLMADTDRPRATTGPPKAAPRGGALTPGSAQHGRPGSRNNHQEETPWN